MRGHRTNRSLWTTLMAGSILLTGVIVGQPVLAGKSCQPCKLTAQLAFHADLGKVRSDYNIAIGKAINYSERAGQREAAGEARMEFKEGTHNARAVRGARKGLCELLKEDRYDPEYEPDDFLTPEETAADPNPYFPLVPGTVYTYESETDEGTETVVVEITANTVEIDGVTCMEVRDTVTLEGEFVEDTLDWYAQHEDGSVWYFGEISFNFEDGEIVDLEGSWKAGDDGAKPGVVMQGTRVVGDAYRQEWLLGEAEDAGQILALHETVTVPAGTFTDCVKTLDINPHDPELVEHKLFAPGVGFVFEIKPDEGETVELISIVGP